MLSSISNDQAGLRISLRRRTEAARLAAARRSSEQLTEIEQAIAGLRAALLSSGPAHAENWALRRAIFTATASPAFVATFDHLHGDVDRILKAGVDIPRSRPPGAIEAMLSEHEMIVQAIHTQMPMTPPSPCDGISRKAERG